MDTSSDEEFQIAVLTQSDIFMSRGDKEDEDDLLQAEQELLRALGQKNAVAVSMEPTRLELLTDAIFGVIATVLYLPMMALLELDVVNDVKSEGMDTETNSTLLVSLGAAYGRSTGSINECEDDHISILQPGQHYELEMDFDVVVTLYGLALMTFLVVTYFHFYRLNIDIWIKHYDGFLRFLFLLYMLTLGLIPFTLVMQSSYPCFESATFQYGTCTVLVLTTTCTYIYLFLPRSAHLSWRIWSTLEKQMILAISATTMMVFILTILTAWFTVSYAFYNLLLIPVSRAAIRMYYRKSIREEAKQCSKRRSKALESKKRRGKVQNRERFIIYVDAVFAFSATLIAADLKVGQHGEVDDFTSQEIRELFTEKLPEILSYIWCFTVLLMLWLLHDRIISCTKLVNRGVYWLTGIGLSVVPSIAFGCKFVLLALWTESEQTTLALYIACIAQLWVLSWFGALYLFATGRPDMLKKQHAIVLRSRSWKISVRCSNSSG